MKSRRGARAGGERGGQAGGIARQAGQGRIWAKKKIKA